MHYREIEGTKANVKYSFGVKDNKARVIGCQVWAWKSEVVENGSGLSGYRDEDGDPMVPGVTYFSCAVHATRDDVSYGASQGWQHFKTEGRRLAFIERRIATSRKRALKLAA